MLGAYRRSLGGGGLRHVTLEACSQRVGRSYSLDVKKHSVALGVALIQNVYV